MENFRNVPSGPRPKVDPLAGGEVDPSLYPEAKESTHKIRGKSDIMEMLFQTSDQELIVVKVFYFFFYSAFGSLFPLMGVYFKQMGMSPSQCGLLIGCRPFVEILASPYWSGYAERMKKGKALLLLSLSCWIIFTMPIGYLQPPADRCLKETNSSYSLELPVSVSKYNRKQSATTTNVPVKPTPSTQTMSISFAPSDVGKSPFVVNYQKDSKQPSDMVTPLFTSVAYKVQDVKKAFFLMLLLIIIGEFFSAPAITLMDTAVLALLGDDADKYGHQRMFGSVGWGVSMFLLGIALDRSTAFSDHPCGKPGDREKNYKICFFAFSVLMGGALVAATQIPFRNDERSEGEGEEDGDAKKALSAGGEDQDAMEDEIARQLNLPSMGGGGRKAGGGVGQVEEKQSPNVGKTKMFAQTTKEMPEWVTVLKHFSNVKCGAFLFVAWFMGFGIGLIFTFLFWHLQEFGGSPTLFGFASVINHISEIYAYFYSHKFISKYGHVKVLCFGLAGNVVRFLYVSWLTNPYMVLPFELMQGVTHAAVWAACCSYIAHNTPQELRTSAQGVLQGLHHGFGRGCGAVIGGYFVTYYGSTNTFRGYGIFCAFVLFAFVFINFYRKDTGFVSDLPASEDPHQIAEESVHLAPHGVPSNPLPRAVSSSRLQDMASQGQNESYGSTLNPSAAPRNPFYDE